MKPQWQCTSFSSSFRVVHSWTLLNNRLSVCELCLQAFQRHLGQQFARSEAKLAAFEYLQTLLLSVERKNSWQMAEEAGHLHLYRFKNLLGRSVLGSEEVCATGRRYCVEHLNRLGVLGLC